MTPEERKAYMKEYRKSEEYKAKERERQKKIYEEKKEQGVAKEEQKKKYQARMESGAEQERQKIYAKKRSEAKKGKHLDDIRKMYKAEWLKFLATAKKEHVTAERQFKKKGDYPDSYNPNEYKEGWEDELKEKYDAANAGRNPDSERFNRETWRTRVSAETMEKIEQEMKEIARNMRVYQSFS